MLVILIQPREKTLMKLRGRKSAGERFKDVIVFPRGNDAPIAFWVLALDEEWDFFNDSCPRPKPQKLTTAEGVKEDEDDLGYKQQLESYFELYSDFMVVHSITILDNEIEWEKVDVQKPSTWKNWRAEMREFGLTRMEMNKLLLKCRDVNSLNEDLMEQARADFIRGRQTG
jgi:hypothetical protein